MTFWILAAILTLAVLAGVLWPLVRGRAAARRAADYDIEVYRDQLAEVERNHAQGLIGDSEAEAARGEIGRRILEADRRRTKAAGGESGSRWLSGGAMAAVAAAVPVGAFVVYAQLGSPGMEAKPFAAREDVRTPQVAGQGAGGGGAAGGQGGQMPEIEQAIAQLQQRLEQQPDDVRGWMLLGRTQAQRQRYDAAVEAFGKAHDLRPDDPQIAAAYGEALVMASGGTVTPKAEKLFEAAHEQQPEAPQVNFYLALADLQQGAPQDALARWKRMVEGAGPEATWLNAVQQQMARAEGQLGIEQGSTFAEVAPERTGGSDASGGGEAAGSGPTREQMQAAQDMDPEARQAMIRNMVDRLAGRLEENPNDVEGWLQLARSYEVLGQPENARDALARAAEIAPENVEVLSRYARALRAAAGQRQTETSVEISRRIVELDPKNAEALWFVGVHHAAEGRLDKARELFDRALAQLPESPQTAELRKRADEIVGTN